MMDAISSAVIGGTLLSGGVGTPIGSLFGVLIKGTISSLITAQGTLSSWWVRIVLSALHLLLHRDSVCTGICKEEKMIKGKIYGGFFVMVTGRNYKFWILHRFPGSLW